LSSSRIGPSPEKKENCSSWCGIVSRPCGKKTLRPIASRQSSARDGTIVEVSEWKSQEAIDAAHKNANVLAMWDKFFAICDCVPLNTLDEAKEMFAGFEPIAD